MNSLLLVIDCQKGFINNYTRQYVDKINELIDCKKYDFVAFTRFINNEESIFSKKLNYKGCINEDDQEIVIDTKGYKVFDKNIYSAVNEELEQYIKQNDINEVYLCGFDTDACIQKNAIDLFERNMEVYVLKDYCMSSEGIENHDFTIENLKRLIGYRYVI